MNRLAELALEKVSCPRCNVKKNENCITPTGRKYRAKPGVHKERIEKYNILVYTNIARGNII